MRKQTSRTPGPCNPACTNTIRFMTDNVEVRSLEAGLSGLLSVAVARLTFASRGVTVPAARQ